MNPADLIGWGASLVLLATVSRQVWKQWKEQSEAGVSHWLFIGQMVASAGFTIYSWLLGAWVFVVTNLFMLVAAICGQLICVQVRRRAAGRGEAAG
jgi:MtN3 and saliva related transmembrane protein